MDWRDIDVAPDGTHHTRSGQPLYADRYDAVLKFHAPGLAPVRAATRAWHIDTAGLAAYDRRFARTFGFYEQRAAVESVEGWHHIRPDGTDAYPARFAWCGNYQGELVTVRSREGEYLHLDIGGDPLYRGRWRYAGDYRDGVAVVQGADGRSTHIDASGALTHACWFLDLDVFHKGFARARDADGWMHVDRLGRPAYARRFRAVEPFYNGQARVERLDGGLEVIDQEGRTIVELRPSLSSDFAGLSGDLVGYWRTQTIRAAVELRVFDALPGATGELAKRLGTDPPRTGRLLRALGEMQLVLNDGSTWRPTSRGAHLRADDAVSLAGASAEYGGRLGARWAALPDAVRSAGWRPADIWDEVARDEGRLVAHHRMLRSYARHDYVHVVDELDLAGADLVVDAGGGVGVLAELLLLRHPRLRVVLLERLEVAAQAQVAADLRPRLEVRTGNLHERWNVSAHAVVLARVLHDWDDDDVLRILRRAREALPAGGRIHVVEMVLDEATCWGALCDLHLLVTTGGRERTTRQFGALFEESGFALREVRRSAAVSSIIVGVAR